VRLHVSPERKGIKKTSIPISGRGRMEVIEACFSLEAHNTANEKGKRGGPRLIPKTGSAKKDIESLPDGHIRKRKKISLTPYGKAILKRGDWRSLHSICRRRA